MRIVRSVVLGAGTAALAIAAAGLPVVLMPSAAGAETVALSPTGHVKFYLRGNGHARGLSQYGALGAAKKDMAFADILAFYYPHTTLVTLKASSIRVRLASAGSALTVQAESSLSVGTVGPLPAQTEKTDTRPSVAIARYRLTPDATTTLTLQRQLSAATTWTDVATKLPSGTAFTRGSGHTVRVYTTDGGSTRFYGSVRAVRAGSAFLAVNNVGLDSYTRGVTPREVSPDWPTQAVATQAVAARTYGRYAVEHPQSADYDICDSSMCQVYGGYAHYDAAGAVVYTDDAAAVANNSNQVLQYQGKAIFSQFSASNGGWSVDGGQPYLTAHADPYDAADGADPYSLQAVTRSVPALAKTFGLAQLTAIVITQRDGHGAWGGRILTGYLKGVDGAGKAKQVPVTGSDLASAIGAGTTYIGIHPLTDPA